MRKIIVIAIATLTVTASCNSKRTAPKPRGYYRIEMPAAHSYVSAPLDGYPYSFEVSEYARVSAATEPGSEPYWINISYPAYNAKIHISYKHIRGNLAKFVEDAYLMTYKHTIKADAIAAQQFESEDGRTFGLLYEISGNAASNVQFYITDSTRHFLRGALYFNTHPNADSLRPVIEYITEDIRHIMLSTQWK